MTVVTTTGQGARGTATGTSPSGAAIPGSLITLYISDGSRPRPHAHASAAQYRHSRPAATAAAVITHDTHP